MRVSSLRCLSMSGFHRMAYTEWGPERSERTLVCVHGLGRNGRDFDVIAAALADEGWRVISPDVVGRGRSGRLVDPKRYALPQYLSDMTALIARLEVETVDWLGTSMGGLIGMQLAAFADSPIDRLVLNDVGPFLPKAALERIGSYVGENPRFPDRRAAEAWLRQTYAPFGRLTDAHWAHLAEHSFVPAPEGGLALHYDPGIAVSFQEAPIRDVDLWPVWDQIRRPTLVLRGAESDLLTEATANEMTQRGPKPLVLTFPDCGHAPALMDEDQIRAVKGWLSKR